MKKYLTICKKHEKINCLKLTDRKTEENPISHNFYVNFIKEIYGYAQKIKGNYNCISGVFQLIKKVYKLGEIFDS